MKLYADKHRTAKEGNIEIGDTVLIKQKKVNKFSTRFNPTLYQVIRRKGTMLTAKSVHGHYITRNISFFKKVSIAYDGNDDDDNDDICNQTHERTFPERRYPRRERRQIDRYGQNTYGT